MAEVDEVAPKIEDGAIVAEVDEALAKQTVASFSPKIEGGPIAKFDSWKSELEGLDLTSGPLLMRKFLQAFEWTTKAAIAVHKRLDDAIENKNHEEAKAKLERFSDYYTANKAKLGALKDSSSLRESYLSLDEPYRKACAKVNMLRALAKFLDNKAESYRMAHDDSKKIYDKLLGKVPPGSGSYGNPDGSIGDMGY